VDTAGRLQIPKEYLDEVGIGDRATLEVMENGIIVRPVEGRGRSNAPLLQDLEDEPVPQLDEGVRGWWKRLRGRTTPDQRSGL
jgi:bifunctional DNA-binding transcriptional regulator/antitoxin component of YhaV-PrlF toxin-antitoxin module